MKSVLVVDDSAFFGQNIKNRIEKETHFHAVWVKDMAGAIAIMEGSEHDFFSAILDVHLPDAPNGEVIDEVVGRNIPAIVYTSDLSDEIRQLVWSKGIADYALKDDMWSMDYILALLKRLEKNPSRKILVVDDSRLFRKSIKDLLEIQRYQVVVAESGAAGLEVIAQHPDIQVAIVDYQMEDMDGIQLTKRIREHYHKDEMAIIGISSEGQQLLAARFLKNGADDFIIKQSFLTEEFYIRVIHHIDNLERIQMIKDAAIRDYLTRLHNRRYFFDAGEKLYANAVRRGTNMTCAMIDIDHFKKVNDTYGHDVGDLALKHVADLLRNRMRKTDIVARMGGEEFCVLAVNMEASEVAAIFEKIRWTIENTPITITGGQQLAVTVSMGIVTRLQGSLDDMIKAADALLYKAKETGRNRIVISHQ